MPSVKYTVENSYTIQGAQKTGTGGVYPATQEMAMGGKTRDEVLAELSTDMGVDAVGFVRRVVIPTITIAGHAHVIADLGVERSSWTFFHVVHEEDVDTAGSSVRLRRIVTSTGNEYLLRPDDQIYPAQPDVAQ